MQKIVKAVLICVCVVEYFIVTDLESTLLHTMTDIVFTVWDMFIFWEGGKEGAHCLSLS